MYAAVVIGTFFMSVLLLMFKRGKYWKVLGAVGLLVSVISMKSNGPRMNVQRGPSEDPGLPYAPLF